MAGSLILRPRAWAPPGFEIARALGGSVLLVEGLDLAGKSTLVPRLAERFQECGLSVRCGRNALCADNPVAREADSLRRFEHRDPGQCAQLFLAAHLWDAAHFVRPGPGELHLQDSCWLRTLAWEEVEGRGSLARALRLAALSFPRFDAALYLTAPLAVRRERLAARTHNDWGDHLVFSHPERFLRLEARLRRLTEQFTGARVLDTAKATPEEVLQAAWRWVQAAQLTARPRRSI